MNASPSTGPAPHPHGTARSPGPWRTVGALLAVVVVATACGADGRPLAETSAEGGRRATGSAAGPVINEFVARSDTSWLEADGSSPDWIELHNPTSEAVSLGAFVLTDAPDDPSMAPLDGTLVLPPGGFLLFFADGRPELGPTHLPFSLSAAGEELALLHVDGGGEVLSFGAVQTDFAWARSTDGCLDTPSCIEQVWLGTPGASNEGR